MNNGRYGVDTGYSMQMVSFDNGQYAHATIIWCITLEQQRSVSHQRNAVESVVARSPTDDFYFHSNSLS